MPQSAYSVFEYESLPSTQDEAKRLLASGVHPPYVVIAKHQTAGRGRSGRSWMSLPHNLQCTVVLSSDIRTRDAGQYAFVVAVAVAQTISQFGVQDVQLKWPNDVLLNGKKIAGILLESDIDPCGKLTHLFVGIGINVGSSPDGAIALKDVLSVCPEPHDVLISLCKTLDATLKDLYQSGFALIRKKWLSHAYGLGMPLRIRLPQRSFEGIFLDIAEDGSLLVQAKDDVAPQRVYTGDVFFGEIE